MTGTNHRAAPGITVYGEAAVHVVTSVAPTPEVAFGQVDLAIGGPAAVVAAQLASLGHRARFVGTVGADPAGGFVREELSRLGVDCTDLVAAGRTPRIVARVDGQGAVALAADVSGQRHRAGDL